MKAGSLYYHFASKDDLLVSVLERGIELMTDRFELVELEWSRPSRRRPTRRRTRSRLLAHVVGHLEVLHGHYPYTSLHITTFRTAPEAVRVAVVPFRDAYEAKWTALLAELLPERPADEISILRLVLFGAMNSSIEWFDAGRGNLDHFANVVTDQFCVRVSPVGKAGAVMQPVVSRVDRDAAAFAANTEAYRALADTLASDARGPSTAVTGAIAASSAILLAGR
ncbi:MAG: hypothetical protein R2710_05470 [Acidimicrobiales bacterium]